MNKKRNAVEWAMHYRQIIILVVCCLVAFGIYSLPNMRKNEFPDFTIRSETGSSSRRSRFFFVGTETVLKAKNKAFQGAGGGGGTGKKISPGKNFERNLQGNVCNVPKSRNIMVAMYKYLCRPLLQYGHFIGFLLLHPIPKYMTIFIIHNFPVFCQSANFYPFIRCFISFSSNSTSIISGPIRITLAHGIKNSLSLQKQPRYFPGPGTISARILPHSCHKHEQSDVGV